MSFYSSRDEVIKIILARKISFGLKWTQIAERIGCSKEWTTAACLGQMKFGENEANKMVEIFRLVPEAKYWLTTAPSRGSSSASTSKDPLLYRFQEVINIYGGALKELINEQFGDGIMSAVDFKLNLEKEPSNEGDRVKITMSGKFLPYKPF
ncbi:Cyanate hydratase [Meloidogyne graminicola]|uniref:Cyanate hydratase n=1 Tax=Meloidogyne graminicola TaxID=189291 RepID=A0A8T0A548_9BILA|nr:Cyanate hydratase [Meloidogyne graminicola]